MRERKSPHDDPAFGYRFITDELAHQGMRASESRVARLCSQQRNWSIFTKKRGRSRRPGPPVHDDLVERVFSATLLDELWLTDITEHRTAEGKLYLCAIKDACSTRIVGYSMSDRMTASLAVSALRNAIALRDPHNTSIIHSDRGSSSVRTLSCALCVITDCAGRCRVGACADNAAVAHAA